MSNMNILELPEPVPAIMDQDEVIDMDIEMENVNAVQNEALDLSAATAAAAQKKQEEENKAFLSNFARKDDEFMSLIIKDLDAAEEKAIDRLIGDHINPSLGEGRFRISKIWSEIGISLEISPDHPILDFFDCRKKIRSICRDTFKIPNTFKGKFYSSSSPRQLILEDETEDNMEFRCLLQTILLERTDGTASSNLVRFVENFKEKTTFLQKEIDYMDEVDADDDSGIEEPNSTTVSILTEVRRMKIFVAEEDVGLQYYE